MEWKPSIGDVLSNRWRVVSGNENGFRFSGFHVRQVDTDIPAYCTALLRSLHLSGYVKLFRLSACIVKELSMRHLSSIPEFIEFDYWKGDHEYMYFCTKPVGPRLEQLRDHLPAEAHRRFSPYTCLHFALEMLYAIQDVHNEGYLIRRVVPNAFRVSMDPSLNGQLMFDASNFWYARRWLHGKTPLPLRNLGYCVTSEYYNSLNVTNLMDQTRLDDMWSWFYVVVDLINGTLPWAGMEQDADTVFEQMNIFTEGKKFWHERASEWLATSPEEFLEIFKRLQSSAPQDEPEYGRFAQLLKQAMSRVVKDTDEKSPALDWEPDGKYHDALGPLMAMDV